MTAAPVPVFVPRTRHDAVDRRLGGTWTRAQTLKNGFIAAATSCLVWAFDRLPESALLFIGRWVGRAAALVPAARRAARRAADRCFSPEQAARVARACFEHAGESAATCLLLRRASVSASRWVDVPDDALAVLTKALSLGRGVVFVSAHLGPFELVAARIAELGIPAAMVVRESYDPRLDGVIDAHRVARGLAVIHRGRPGASFRIVRALRSGKPVGFLPDLGGRVPSIQVQFLGERTAFPVGPQQLAQRLGAPLVIGTLYRNREGAPFGLRIDEVDTEAPLVDLTQRVASLLEQAIYASPNDFPWMARR